MRISILISLSVLLSTASYAQVKSGTAEAKTLKKAVYGGTYMLSNQNVGVFFQEENELAAYEFDKDAKFVNSHQGAGVNDLLMNTRFDEGTTSPIPARDISHGKGLNVVYAKESWGSLKLVNGLLYLAASEKFIDGFELEEKDVRKLKVEGTWRTTNIGARAVIPKEKTAYNFKAPNGRSMNFDFSKTTNPPIVPHGGYLQSAGIITEKVSIKDPSPHNANRLVVYRIDLDNAETTNIHIMPYSMRGINAGSDAQGNFTVLTVPLNAPSTYGPHKPLNAKDEERQYLYMYRFDNDNKLIDEQKIKSDLGNANNYQTIAAGESTYLVGTGSAGGKGFISSFPAQKTDAVSIARMGKDGKLSAFTTYADKELENRLETFGSKSNFKFTGGPAFYSSSVLENGNVFLLGRSDGWHHGMLLSEKGELIRYYLFPHLDPAEHKVYTEQLHVRGNKVYVLLADQPHELTNEKQTSTSSSSSTHTMGGGYSLRTTTTSTYTRQLFEIFHRSNIFIINGADGTTSKVEPDEQVKNFYTMGNTPAIFSDEAIYLPGRIKANKGKEVSLLRIDY